ncbi:hypothetical protein BH10PLA1_BH10PLA1_13270 [soil metagenome]
MFKNLLIVAALAVVVGLPFYFRQPAPSGNWKDGDPVLVVVSPHNEAIRYEFATAFSRWHEAKFGKPVKIDWRSIGGTTEISRYLLAEYTTSTRAWWERQGKTWPAGASDTLTGKSLPTDPAEAAVFKAMRNTDDGGQITCGIDLFFGGGEYDHSSLYRSGATVPPWPEKNPPAGLFTAADGTELIPARMSGEIWRTPTLFGSAVSTFGICYNVDRLHDLGVAAPPKSWSDLADPVYFRQVGVADPTKSGSIAKSFENVIDEKIHARVAAAGFSDDEIAKIEAAISTKNWKPGDQFGELALRFPRIEVYQRCIESGWVDGIHLVQLIGANARYFTDAASKIPIDVSIGDAAVGMAIDFYGRFQAQSSLGDNGEPHMVYITPVGGTSVSCDPVGLLRGAGGHATGATPEERKANQQEIREIAVRFIEFCLSEDGQCLWTYKPGEPGGPEKFALRRLPIRRDFYLSNNPAINAAAAEHLKHAADPLDDPTVDPYVVAKTFVYYPRWTARHFGVQRDIIRAMCMDSADELKEAWSTIIAHGGPTNCPQAMERLGILPTITLTADDGSVHDVAMSWETAPTIHVPKYQPLDYMREWTSEFRKNYAEAAQLARDGK